MFSSQEQNKAIEEAMECADNYVSFDFFKPYTDFSDFAITHVAIVASPIVSGLLVAGVLIVGALAACVLIPALIGTAITYCLDDDMFEQFAFFTAYAIAAACILPILSAVFIIAAVVVGPVKLLQAITRDISSFIDLFNDDSSVEPTPSI